MRYITKSEKETQALGKDFGGALRGGEVFLLTGDLGGGKTQFTKGLAGGLGIDEAVTSPTFNYENIYSARDGLRLYHFDLYRSEQVDNDIRDLMLEAFVDPVGVTVVEWAERAKAYWPQGATLLEFDWVSENERRINVSE